MKGHGRSFGQAGALPNSQSPTPEGKAAVGDEAKIVLIDTNCKCVSARSLRQYARKYVKQNVFLCSFEQATQRGWQTFRERETYAQEGAAMTDLLLKPAPARGPNDYEVIADDWIVGRIVLSDVSPAERPWMWSLDHEFYQGREQDTRL